jgi:hypothetical protein
MLAKSTFLAGVGQGRNVRILDEVIAKTVFKRRLTIKKVVESKPSVQEVLSSPGRTYLIEPQMKLRDEVLDIDEVSYSF